MHDSEQSKELHEGRGVDCAFAAMPCRHVGSVTFLGTTAR